MNGLLELDYQLFFWINQIDSGILEWIMPYWRNKYFWIPLYVFFLFFALLNLKGRLPYFLLGMALTVALADFSSSKIVKPMVKRVRPCNQVKFQKDLTLRVDCGGGYSFTSSHATNHFAIAVYLFFSLGSLMGRFKWLMIIWAASISLGQVYVGVHFPLDILGGTLLGSLIGLLVYSLLRRNLNLTEDFPAAP